MNRSVFVLLAGIALGGTSNRAFAQLTPQVPAQNVPQVAPNAPLTAPAPSAKRAHVVVLKNVSASVMAFWLDPENHVRPRELGVEKAGFAPETEGVFKLPAGVDQIVAIDPQSAILVFGTDAGVAELNKTVTLLDQPQRRVEIELNWVEIRAAEDVRGFGIDFPDSEVAVGRVGPVTPRTPKTAPQIGTVRAPFAATLGALVAQHRAKVLASPRATMINNLAGQVSSFVTSLAAVKIEGDAPSFAPLFEGAAQIGVELGLDVTPTINNDDTVTILLTTSSKLKIKTAKGAEFVTAEPLTGLQSIVNVRDGDTFALAGLSSRPAAAKDAKSPSNLLLFVTARIVRPAGEVAVPSAK